MDFPEYARQEAASFADRLATAAEGVRSALEARLAEADADLERARASLATHERERDDADARARRLAAELAAAHADLEALRAAVVARDRDCEALSTTAAALREENEALVAEGVELQRENDALRQQTEKAAEDRGRLLAEIAAAGRAGATAAAILDASLRATETLAAAPDVSALFAALVKAAAAQMPRAAIFRVKGNRLEGEHVAGAHDAAGMTKLVIPMSVDTVLTRAVGRGSVETADGDLLDQARSPFGGTPAAALAAPIRLADETIAVLYAESDETMGAAHVTCAALLVRHTEVLLSKLSRELRTVKELRDYAGMLLQEAEHMYLADVESQAREEDCVRRLRDAIECGRQLYAQRAELEGSTATGLFDDQIAAAIRAPASRFAAALEAAVDRPSAQRTAS